MRESLDLVDDFGSPVELVSDTSRVYVTVQGGSADLSVDRVRELRDYLTAWLGDQETMTEAPASDNVVPLSPRLSVVDPDRSILADAEAAVYGPREADYGHPRQNFTRTAILWHGVLLDKLAEGETITPEDVALCMVGVKLAREVHQPKRDNRVDGAGYFACLDRLESGK